MLKISYILIILSLLSSCSHNYQVTTNLDKENFKAYYSAAEVNIYKNDKDIKGEHIFVGLVEGQDCQVKPHHAAPDKVNARTQARQKAFDINANAIVFTGCADLPPEKLKQLSQSNDSLQCNAIIICYGRAFSVAEDAAIK